MKPMAAGTTSGCLVWLLVFFFLSMCFCPLAMGIGGFSATLGADAVAGIVGPYLCPEESAPEIITFQTTSTDDFGNEQPATGYEMQCVAADGAEVRAPSPDYAFYWVGLLMVGALILSGLGALLLAAPVGGWVTRRRARRGAAGGARL